MEIADLRVHMISAKLNRTFWMSIEPYTTASEIIVEIEDDRGNVGYGQIHGRPMQEIVRILERFKPMLIGQNPLQHAHIWQQLFDLTTSREYAQWSASLGQPHFGPGSRPQILAAIAGVDIALWDLKGKILGQPIWRLLGAGTNRVPCYASGGYYYDVADEVSHLVEEVRMYVEEYGFNAAKIKVGRLAIEDDVKRIRAIREAFPDIKLMLDANAAYDVPTAIAAARAFEPYDIHWFEEPVRWYDPVFGTAQVAQHTRIPIASGEGELERWGCRDLIDHGGIRFMQFDATRGGGVTEWLRIADYAAHHHVLMAPHHDAQIHGHLVAAVPNGYILETFVNPERDPLWRDLFSVKPEIKDGMVILSDRPGFGFELDREMVEHYRVKE